MDFRCSIKLYGSRIFFFKAYDNFVLLFWSASLFVSVKSESSILWYSVLLSCSASLIFFYILNGYCTTFTCISYNDIVLSLYRCDKSRRAFLFFAVNLCFIIVLLHFVFSMRASLYVKCKKVSIVWFVFLGFQFLLN